ncbi:chemotaxis response regulator protein-glutamate methylesterase [Paenibacillus sp. GD4]|uniref:protein-glutamate methylesterase/protein-glutamine glutaminase n=1 Tax=Paenibacillus sp. GD4 TaxID=3068890 RepID=UPI0027964BAB|nr:chemotaxis response regulator protein-glutamate methylesterase [Paenibacillus sp. GD4]MDQ1912916.1 chemotaxis response regulator protein-glutamate methylesterase [Paenibacillus sp. GD4]
MKQYGVLIVDDSAFMRRAISLIFDKDPDFFIVGIARNGIEALEKIHRFRPDVVTMDIEMPEMDGLSALHEIMKSDPVPVVMLSTHTSEGTEASLRALELGAVDFFLKSDLMKDPMDQPVLTDFLARVKAAANAKNIHAAGSGIAKEEPFPVPYHDSGSKTDLLVIGCSTGGPSALQSILPRFSSDFPAGIVVVQHMPPGFTKPLADRFDTICSLQVKEAEDGDMITPGVIHICPAGYHTIFQKAGGRVILRVLSSESYNALYKPSVDVTLQSAAVIYGNRLLAVVLTGMGVDGLIGCKEVKLNGGRVLVEAEQSCIVYGMPKAVYEAGLADRQALLGHMYQQIISFV